MSKQEWKKLYRGYRVLSKIVGMARTLVCIANDKSQAAADLVFRVVDTPLG